MRIVCGGHHIHIWFQIFDLVLNFDEVSSPRDVVFSDGFPIDLRELVAKIWCAIACVLLILHRCNGGDLLWDIAIFLRYFDH